MTMPSRMMHSPAITMKVGYSFRKRATHRGPRIISHRAITEAFWAETCCTPIL